MPHTPNFPAGRQKMRCKLVVREGGCRRTLRIADRLAALAAACRTVLHLRRREVIFRVVPAVLSCVEFRRHPTVVVVRKHSWLPPQVFDRFSGRRCDRCAASRNAVPCLLLRYRRGANESSYSRRRDTRGRRPCILTAHMEIAPPCAGWSCAGWSKQSGQIFSRWEISRTRARPDRRGVVERCLEGGRRPRSEPRP